MSLVRREKSFVAKNTLIDPHVNLCRLAASATIFCTKILSRAVAERVSWQEAFYGFCMSLNVAFLALVYHPAAEEAFSKSKKPSLSLPGNWLTFHSGITAAKCPSDGKTLEKCRNANLEFFVND